MTDTPKISIIIPIYKVEPYLRKCLDSVINQTYKHLEIILIDDGSPDSCGSICDEYSEKDNRIRVYHTVNRGAYAARNLALDASTGDYISFVDGDDWIDPDLYKTLLNLETQYDADIAQCEMLNEGVYQQIHSKALGYVCTFTSENLTRVMFEEILTHGLPAKIFRADIWTAMRFDEEYYHVDAMTMAKVADYCNVFVRTDRQLYHYNTENQSITRGKKNMKHITSMEKLFDTYAQVSIKVPGDGSYFICKEIPSGGRLIPPGNGISVKTAIKHIRYMHAIFVRHWERAKNTDRYRQAPAAKKVLWNLYEQCPLMASLAMLLRRKIRQSQA